MDVVVRRVDLSDDDSCAEVRAVLDAALTAGRPWVQCPTVAESVVEWRHEDPAQRLELWAALDGHGVMVGVLMLWLTDEDNRDKVWFVLRVHPGLRRRGAGRALVATLVSRARDEGRRELLTETFLPPGSEDDLSHPHQAFAQEMGFDRTSLEVVRHLALPVPAPVLDALESGATPSWSERYRLESFRGGVREPLQPSLCRLMNLLGVDAPTGDVDWEPDTLTPERYREEHRLSLAQGRDWITTVALDASTGEVAAYSDLKLPAAPSTVAWQDGTYVHRDHRGHRLGTAVKVENLRLLQRTHPERVLVTTGNEETNRWMVDINVALGFEVKEVAPTYRRLLG